MAIKSRASKTTSMTLGSTVYSDLELAPDTPLDLQSRMTRCFTVPSGLTFSMTTTLLRMGSAPRKALRSSSVENSLTKPFSA